jgi:addiction module RelB/DinJ family antitoxin
MADTSPVSAIIDTSLKESAEAILTKLGITPSAAIQMFYSQIVLHGGLPFDVRIPPPEPAAGAALSRAELDAKLMKGVESLKAGKGYSADEVDVMLWKEFCIDQPPSVPVLLSGSPLPKMPGKR